MQSKYSFAVFIYAITAIIDATLGINTYNSLESYIFKFAAASTIIAISIYLTSKNQRFMPLLFISASLVLSIVVLTQGRTDLPIPINLALKIVAVILTLKPELIEIEIITEDEEDS